MFFLHFLVVASALFCLSGGYKLGHQGEYPIHPAHTPVHEMTEMHLQKPVVPLVFLDIPVPEQLICVLLLLHQVLTQLTLIYFQGTQRLRIALGQLIGAFRLGRLDLLLLLLGRRVLNFSTGFWGELLYGMGLGFGLGVMG